MLAASKGSRITLKVEGKDSAQAIQTLGKLIENKFGEE
jgi:phosphotransferase system HPr-like phosphotransfer protein